jgi:hypothetical protein
MNKKSPFGNTPSMLAYKKDAAIARFREAVIRLDNTERGTERGLKIAGELLPLLRHLYPKLAGDGDLDDLFGVVATKMVKSTTDVHGGGDKALAAEALRIHLVAIVPVLNKRTGLSFRKGRQRVASWCPPELRISSKILENWSAQGKSMALEAHLDRPEALRKCTESLLEAVALETDIEACLRAHTERLCGRVKTIK